jgi:dipeptide/tripeptide permease
MFVFLPTRVSNWGRLLTPSPTYAPHFRGIVDAGAGVCTPCFVWGAGFGIAGVGNGATLGVLLAGRFWLIVLLLEKKPVLALINKRTATAAKKYIKMPFCGFFMPKKFLALTVR